MEKTEVLIIGGGPVGAFAAYALAQLNIDTVLVEAAGSCAEDMRASTLHPPTLEMLDELGLYEELEQQGLKAPIYHYRNRGTGEVFALDLGEVDDVLKHPFRLQCEQFKLARLASAKFAEHPRGRLRLNERAIFVEQDQDGVTVHVERALEVVQYRAKYVIAADGANSLVRKLLQVQFTGFTYPEKFLTLSTRYAVDQHFDKLAYVSYMADAAQWCVLLRVPEFWRVLVPVAEETPDAELLSDAKKTEVMRGLVGDAAESLETYHRTLYRVHQRVAECYHHGRILLAGDAAHLNNPLGGFGMNSGIHDVWNLTRKLELILRSDADADNLLAHYDRQRRTVMNEFVQTQTIQNKKMLESGDGRALALQQKFEQLLANEGERRDYLLAQSMYASLQTEAAVA